MDTFMLIFGGAFTRTVDPTIEQLVALMAGIEFNLKLSRFAEIIDNVMAFTSVLDAHYLMSGTQQTVPRQLHATLATLHSD
eukprot:5871248-Amphidinium_carterae.1